MLDTDFPLPTVAVNWNGGWLGALPPYAVELAVLRKDSCGAIYEHLTACQMGVGTSCRQTLERVDRILAYAQKLQCVCSDANNKSGSLSKMHQQLHRRSFPLEFEWCFPAEPDPEGNQKVAWARSTLPSFEYMCVVSCACIILMSAANTNREYNEYIAAMALYSKCQSLVLTTVQNAIGTVMNNAQWHRLHRHKVPLQLLPTWLAVLAAKAHHSAQLCSIMHLSSTQDAIDAGSTSAEETLILLTRHAYHSVKSVLRLSRRLMVLEQYLWPHQTEMVATLYSDLLRETHRLRIQCLLQEADPLISQGDASLGYKLLQSCKVSMDEVWGPECSECQQWCSPERMQQEQTFYTQVFETIHSLQDTASKSSSVTTTQDEEDSSVACIDAVMDRYTSMQWNTGITGHYFQGKIDSLM